MFKLNAALTLMVLFCALIISCQKDIKSGGNDPSLQLATGKKPVANPLNCDNYEVKLDVEHSTTGPVTTTFIWRITNPNPGNGSGTTLQNLSHWTFVPSTCLKDNWQDVLSAAYNTGSGWVTITPLPLIEPDPSLSKAGCSSGDVFKFNVGTSGSTPTQYKMVLAGYWGTGELNVFFKSGANTGCCSASIADKGIACREDEPCSYSQGYWFANNTNHPSGVHPWPTTLTIGGHIYTNAEGLAIWNASTTGTKDAERAFTQLAAVMLSGVSNEPAISSAVQIIQNWLTNYGGKLTPTNLRNQTAAEITLYGDAKAAASAISEWINTHHCGNDDVTDF